MKTSSEDKVANRIRWGYLTAFLLLLASYILSFYTTKQLVEQTQLVTRTNNIINNLDRVLSDIKDAEAGLRGFYLTDDEELTTKKVRVPDRWCVIKPGSPRDGSQK